MNFLIGSILLILTINTLKILPFSEVLTGVEVLSYTLYVIMKMYHFMVFVFFKIKQN